MKNKIYHSFHLFIHDLSYMYVYKTRDQYRLHL